MMQKMEKTKIFLTLMEYDKKITKTFICFLLNFVAFRSLKNHCQFLEISCHGIAWLSGWLTFCWIVNNSDLYEMQVNMLFGLLLDIVIVALIKAATRRRRPATNSDAFSIGPDKFSFPSGHASRAFFILGFFTFLYPLPRVMLPALSTWAVGVTISRLLMYRHYLLDVCAGMILGLLEATLLYIIWLGPDFTKFIMQSISEDYVPGGAE